MKWLLESEQQVTKADIAKIRRVVREWIVGRFDMGNGRYIDHTTRLNRLEPILVKFKPTGPVTLWRNARGTPDEFSRPTAWSYQKHAAQGYDPGSRRLVSHTFTPDDIYVSIPHIEAAARRLGLSRVDELGQAEVIVKPNKFQLPK